MYLYRARDRRLMEQCERDIALTLQRDYRTFNTKKTTELSNRITIYDGYLGATGVGPQAITWLPGSEVDCAFTVLQALLTQLSKGQYQASPPSNRANPGVWPVSSINWVWIQSLYAFVNPAYDTWLTDNGIVVPDWADRP